MGEIIQLQLSKLRQNSAHRPIRDLYVLDFDGFLALCFNLKGENATKFMTLDYVKKNPNWHLYVDESALLNRQADIIILTARHPCLAEQISDMCYGWQVIGRDFDTDLKRIEKRTAPVNLDWWEDQVVRYKIKHLRRFAQQYRWVFFLDDDWKWYEGKRIASNVSVFKVPKTWEQFNNPISTFGSYDYAPSIVN